MYRVLIVLLTWSVVSCVSVTGDGDISHRGRQNHLVSVLKPILPSRVTGVLNHTLYYDQRAGGDCQPNCPQVDVWMYEYAGKVSSKPISTLKANWKHPKEARIIAFSLFGKNPIYYQGLLDFLKSFKTVKRINNIVDPVWGLEYFTPRVYIPKHKDGTPQEGELEPYQIKALLDAGCEIAYVDNHLPKAAKDATFWRFMIAAERMPEGQKIRYLLRDADWIMTGAEAYAIGEWIASGKQFHRAHLVQICLGPLTASWWGGSHTGKGPFENLGESMNYFPYRYKYGDDELFLRDAVWPSMKASGSVLTHIIERGIVSNIMSPYAGSCEEPTKRYCNAMNPNNECEDVELPKELDYPSKELGFRVPLSELEKTSSFFEMHLGTERGKKVYEALK